MKKIYLIAGIVVMTVVLVLIFDHYPYKKSGDDQVKGSKIKYSQIKIKDKKIKAEVADNLELRLKGLSGHKSFCSNCAMLFVFERADIYPFWMKEMNFPLDIVWIKDKKIIEIVESAPTPQTAGQIMNYTPNAPADLVLELNGGFCKKYNIKTGDEVIIK